MSLSTETGIGQRDGVKCVEPVGSVCILTIDMRAIELHHLTKRYPGVPAVTAVDEVSAHVEAGEVLGLLGANGAGKTTLIKMVCGLLLPTEGRVEVFGVPCHRREASRHVSAVLEGSRNVYWRLSVEENLAFFAGLQGLPPRAVGMRTRQLVSFFGLGEKRKTVANKLSQGMKQKLAVACALVRGTELVLLDEPTLGLDVETSHELREMILDLARDRRRTIVVSSHNMGIVEAICERVLILARGRVITDDRVDRLLGGFHTRAYRVVVQGTLDELSSSALDRRFAMREVSRGEDRTVIEVEILPGRDFYELMDALRTAGVQLESVTRSEPNLEEVFLRIVREGS